MSRSRRVVFLLLVFGCCLAAAPRAAWSQTPSEAPPLAFRLEVTGTAGVAVGNCVLLHQRPGGHIASDLYFLTAAQLLQGGGQPSRIRIVDAAGNVLEATISDVLLPDEGDGSFDVALIRIPATFEKNLAVPVALEAPKSGEIFLVQDHRGSAAIGRVAFRSSSRVVGDRTVEGADEFLGAPALLENGMFGIVTDHSSTGLPIVTMLTAARAFLSRAIADWQPSETANPLFHIEHRVFEKPLVNTECNDVGPLDVDLPIALSSGELIVDATAVATRPSGLHLGDVTLRTAGDRIVRLRFTMPAPTAFSAFACEHDQALITIGVDIVSMVRR
jgi:hypothetical protein